VSRGLSIQQAVRIIIEENPLYVTLLSSGLVNLSALARNIKPLVDTMIGKDTKVFTIVKALERISMNYKLVNEYPDIVKALSMAEIITYSGMGEVEIPLTEENMDKVAKLRDLLTAAKVQFIILNDGNKMHVIAPLMYIASICNQAKVEEYGMVRIMFAEKAPVGIVTFLVQVMKSNQITAKHVLRYDNDIYIVVDREKTPLLLDIIEKIRVTATLQSIQLSKQ
jgi:predicted regulator of amino acid metabolism with ACT domain